MENKIKKSLSKFLVGDLNLKKESDITRSMINIYRNSEANNHWNTFHEHAAILSKEEVENHIREEIRKNIGFSFVDTRPAPEIVSDMSENIVCYLNRSMQYLASLIYKEDFFNTLSRKEKRNLLSGVIRLDEGYRRDDIMLFSSNSFIGLNNLDSSLFKQVASTLYNKYNKEKDSVEIKIPVLQIRTKEEFPEVYAALFQNDLHEEKSIMMNLRNTAGHSDLGSKVNYYSLGNPTLCIDGKQEDLYSVLQNLSFCYLKKAQKVYNALGREVRKKQGINF